MKPNLMLTITSLLSILFVTFHFTDDTLHAKVGTPEAGGLTLAFMPLLVVWLYGTLVLAERRLGYVIMLVLSLLALGLPVLHMHLMGEVKIGSGEMGRGFFFVWTLFALSVTAMFSAILAAQELWSLRSGQSR